ncbi:MAG: universal stress protein [Cryomorphaceae bacterium]|nr:universal stress protein [Cryomorphaceae bacterium]
MNHILVPIGSSPDIHETLQYAVDFAAPIQSKIFVMEVFNAPSAPGTLANVSEKVAQQNKAHLLEVIGKVDPKSLEIKIVTYNGSVVEGVKAIDKELGIDLIIMAPRQNDIQDIYYLGPTSGSIIKRTNIPTLIVPKKAVFKPFKNVLTAFKSGILKTNRILSPLLEIQKNHQSKVSLLLVKTPGYTEEDLKINTALMDMSSQVNMTQNATTYLGVLEHFRDQKPDLLCVFRRKRGFFVNLLEKSTILKSEFHVSIPVLVLSVKKD